MTRHLKLTFATIASAWMVCVPPVSSDPARVAGQAGAAAPATAADVARLQAEIDRLKEEVREQRQLIMQLVLKYLQTGGDPSAFATPPPPAAGRAGKDDKAGKDGKDSKDGKDVKDGAAGAGERESATVTGRVRTTGQPLAEAYVYFDGPRSAARGHTVEIKQKDKQFSPRVAVVPLGTRVVFPNQDTVIHNVFSTAPGNSFDLGSIKGGEASSPVTLLKPGPVEVFCNIHAKMRSDILVVPNPHWTRVAPDGSFSLAGIPVGTRKLVLWSPAAKPISQQVEVTAKGGTVTFTADAAGVRPHLNKRGAAYGSYDE